MTIYEIINLIPDFVSETLINMKQDDEIKSIGKWHLGHKYNIDEWGVGFFKAWEETETSEGTFYHDWFITVCENSFFLFEPDQKIKNIAKLLSVATLCSLERIIWNLDIPDNVHLVFWKIDDWP